MTISIAIPALVMLLGWLLYFFVGRANNRIEETGRLMFFAGLLVTLLSVAGNRLHLS